MNGSQTSAAPIRLAFATDENYVHQTATALRSILAHNPSPIEATILHAGLDTSLIEDLRASCVSSLITLRFVLIDQDRLHGLPVLNHHRSPAAYFRLLLPDLMPGDADKVLYLDSDIICRGDIRPLWETDVSTVAAGCVREPLMRVDGKRSLWRILVPSRAEAAGLHNAEYFNSGVLLINLSKWREKGVTQRALAWRRDNAHLTTLHDQDALNAVLEGDWLQLSARWNFGPWFPLRTHYSLAANRERLNPVLVHLSRGVGARAYRKLAREYLAATAWGRRAVRDRTYGWSRTTIRRNVRFELTRLYRVCFAFRYGRAAEFGLPASGRLPLQRPAD